MTNSIVVEFLASDGTITTSSKYRSIGHFLEENPTYKYHQVRDVYLKLKNKNINKTTKKLQTIHNSIKVYDEQYYKLLPHVINKVNSVEQEVIVV